MENYQIYPKIDTIWKRNMKKKGIIIPGEYASEEIEKNKEIQWRVTEKIDGTNIRIIWDKKNGIVFKGRKPNSMIPPMLEKALHILFDGKEEIFQSNFGENTAILYGEGFGGRVSGGKIPAKNYNESSGFILFDVWTGKKWLDWKEVTETAKKFNIPHVPLYGTYTLPEILTMVKNDMRSGNMKSNFGDFYPEGIVATASPMILFSNGEPMRWKLKTFDFNHLERFI